MHLPRLLLLSLVISVAACGDDPAVTPDPDAALADASSPDAEVPDASPPDAGEPDAMPVPACSVAPECPMPDTGRVTLCGSILDVATGAPVRVAEATGAACDPVEPAADGPCALRVRAFDPLAFASDPTGTAPLPVGDVVVDDCGFYVIESATRPFNGFIGVVVDAPAGDLRIPTGVAHAVNPGAHLIDLPVYSTATATDEAWTESAGSPFGDQTFAERGVALVHFGAEGVQVTAGGVVQSAARYLTGSDAGPYAAVDPDLTATGPAGAVLVTDIALQNLSGNGGEPEGCTWPSLLGAAVPGVVSVHVITATCP